MIKLKKKSQQKKAYKNKNNYKAAKPHKLNYKNVIS